MNNEMRTIHTLLINGLYKAKINVFILNVDRMVLKKEESVFQWI